MCIFHQKSGEATELQDSFFIQLLRMFFLLFSLGIVEMGRFNLGNWEETAGAEELAFEPALRMLKGLGCQATKGSVIFFPLESRLFFNELFFLELLVSYDKLQQFSPQH